MPCQLRALLLMLMLSIVHINAEHELCGKDDVYSQGLYLWNNNIWNADDTGSSCTYVPNNIKSSSNRFHVLWQWSGAPLVRGFPHIEFKPKILPLRLNNLDSLTIAASWEMAPAALEEGQSSDLPSTEESNASALNIENVEANVCIDIFADPDQKTSTLPGKQAYEIMIWLGRFGKSALPVGNTLPLDPPVIVLLQDTEFKLYTGTNSNTQTVHSWLSNQTLVDFSMDFTPLLDELAARDMLPAEVFLGTVQFGTETFRSSSERQVNFTVSSFEARMESSGGKSEGEEGSSGEGRSGDGRAGESSSSNAARVEVVWFETGFATFLFWAVVGVDLFVGIG